MTDMEMEMVRALAAIDDALSLPQDGCNSPGRTLAAIKGLRKNAQRYGITTTRKQRRQLGRDNARRSSALEPVAPSEWPMNVPAGLLSAWRSRDFLVQVFDSGGVTRVSVSRTTLDHETERWVDGIAWEELQSIKREIGFGTYCAVEVFPPDVDVVNDANMRHLWVLRETPAFVWRRRP